MNQLQQAIQLISFSMRDQGLITQEQVKDINLVLSGVSYIKREDMERAIEKVANTIVISQTRTGKSLYWNSLLKKELRIAGDKDEAE